jgi:hypothetical protein
MMNPLTARSRKRGAQDDFDTLNSWLPQRILLWIESLEKEDSGQSIRVS